MTFRSFLYHLTDVGDSAVLIGVVLTAALYFFVCRDNREAIAILLSLLISAAFITFLKLAFLSCGHSHFDIRSPSGHSALSIAVYGIYPLLLAPRVGPGMKKIIFIFFYGLAFAITATRVILHMHSLNEALLGLVVGLITILIVHFCVLKGKIPLLGGHAPRFNIYVLIGLTVFILCVLNGVHLPAEKTVGDIARFIAAHLSLCSVSSYI